MCKNNLPRTVIVYSVQPTVVQSAHLLSQEFGFTDLGEMQFEEDLCLDVSSSRLGAHVQILNCHTLGGNQKWDYNNEVGHVIVM